MGYLCWALPKIRRDLPAACAVLCSAMWSWLCSWDYQQNRVAQQWKPYLFHLVNHHMNAPTNCVRDMCLCKCGRWFEKGHSASMTIDISWHVNQFDWVCFVHSHMCIMFTAYTHMQYVHATGSCPLSLEFRSLFLDLSHLWCVSCFWHVLGGMCLVCFACYANLIGILDRVYIRFQ